MFKEILLKKNNTKLITSKFNQSLTNFFKFSTSQRAIELEKSDKICSILKHKNFVNTHP